MKKLLMLLCALTLLLGMAGGASAVPFGISSSSLSVSWDWGGGSVSYSPNSLDPPVDLGVGGFHDFTFGKVSIPVSLGGGTASLTVDFFTPTPHGDVTGTGSFSVFSFWFLTLGKIDFGGPTTFAYSYMGAPGGLASVEFDDIKGIKGGTTVALTGTIRNLASPDLAAAPVPEPATILLMGTGLLGLVAYSRKRFRQKS